MVLGELVLRPIPIVVAHRVSKYAAALGVQDDFVRVARRYAQGAYGLAWMDLQRNGFVEHVRESGDREQAGGRAARPDARSNPRELDPELEAKWSAFEDTAGGIARTPRLGDVRRSRLRLTRNPGGAPEYLAQHDFVHVLADYGTNLKGELEVFAFIGRADPDPKGFAWLATLIGLFETGYIKDTGFFERDVRERHIQAPGMHQRLADAIRRGKDVCDDVRRRPVRCRLLRRRRSSGRRSPTSACSSAEVEGRGRGWLRRYLRSRRDVRDPTAICRANVEGGDT